MKPRPAHGVAAVLAALAACTPIVAHPLSDAPTNVCPDHPCDAYGGGATCSLGVCEILRPGGRPTRPFWIVVYVPDTSFFAPGTTHVFYSDENGRPAFTPPVGVANVPRCTPPKCLQIGNMSSVVGDYTVASDVSAAVGYPLQPEQSIPVRVVYEPTGNAQAALSSTKGFPASLALNLMFADSDIVLGDATNPTTIRHSRPLPYGSYQRTLYPEPPLDAVFPPVRSTYTIASPATLDEVHLGTGTKDQPLDDLVNGAFGTSRDAVVTRADGLDGWRVWIADAATGQRISVVKTLSSTPAHVRLDTSGETLLNGTGFRSDVQAVVAPPETWTAVPSIVTDLPSGSGLKALDYPPLPPPVTVNGVVAVVSGSGPLYGYSARLTFTSTSITTLTTPKVLQYATSVDTDDKGRFATVLPPGKYAVTIEPTIGTGQAKLIQTNIDIDRTVTALTFQTPPRPLLHGKALLTDGRPLSSADVIAMPDSAADTNKLGPRPGRARTAADGTFAVELDPGPYVLTVLPQAGTGFPRVVVAATVGADSSSIPDILVPPPTRLKFTLQDPTLPGNPIDHAIVSVMADLPGRITSAGQTAPIEIGSAMSDGTGQVEILLAE